MKPGNLLVWCGAKSGGKREMRIRYTHIGSYGVRFFVGMRILALPNPIQLEIERNTIWKKDCLLLNA